MGLTEDAGRRAMVLTAVVLAVVLAVGGLLATALSGVDPWRPLVTCVAGLVCLVQSWLVRRRARRDVRERGVWHALAGSVTFVGLALLAESAFGLVPRESALGAGLVGVPFGVGAAVGCVLLYQGLVHWNRFKTYLSDPGDWLNGASAAAVGVAGGALVVRLTGAPMDAWAGWQAELWLAHMCVMLVLLGTALTVAALGALMRDRRMWVLTSSLGSATVGMLGAGLTGDAVLAGAATEAAWVVVAGAVTVAALMPSSRVVPRPAKAQAPAVGALVVLVQSIVVLAVDGLVEGEGQVSTAVIAGLGGLGAAARLLRLVDGLSQLARSQHEARTDELTGVANRRALSTALADAAQKHEPAALLVLDLDEFKKVNDRYGHAVGDEVLRVVALRLQAHVSGRSLLGRLGGDEFAVLLTGPAAREAPRLAESLAAAATEPVQIAGRLVRLGTSIGIATDPAGRYDGELMRRADTAMYSAKRAGGGVSTYDEETDRHEREHAVRLEELQRILDPDASTEERTQLVVHYQPQLEVGSGRSVGVEALVRWQHPELGLLAPDAFLSLVQVRGMMPRLTDLVLHRATADVLPWHRDGFRLRLAVNLSTSCLSDPSLLPTVERAITASGLDPAFLKLEITETTVMSDPDLALNVTRRLASHGIGISIDDFGTGYSSLAYLADLPAEELKLDRRFTARVAQEPRTASIVAGTIDLAHHLGMWVVAEGVEDEATLALLSSLGCDHTQGYLHARPKPADEFHRWLTDGRRGAARS